jgi:hypothetical protein
LVASGDRRPVDECNGDLSPTII